jgi:hypothetical protein
MNWARETFRKDVFDRDGNKCIICGCTEGLDAHHIIERRLWGSSCGYFGDNGVTLCSEHHIQAEQTVLSCDELREIAGIKSVMLPEHFYPDTSYDKWGNQILPDGRRLKGELFFDESVQKILKSAGMLDIFCKYVKYPRTLHLPYSEGITKDDRVLKSTSIFRGKRVIVTEKMDGENSSLYNDYMHARSIDGLNHSSRNWLKKFHADMGYNIPEGWRVCGENLYAQHTMEYEELDSFFYLFSIWNEINECLSWDETLEWASLLDLNVVPVLYDGLWNETKIKGFISDDSREGFVVRIADSFSYGDFRNSVAKFVHKKFRQELDENSNFHWRYRPFKLNKIKEKSNEK